MTYTTIKRSEHGKKSYLPMNDLSFAREMSTSTIVWEEVPKVSQHLPVAFKLTDDDGKKSLDLVVIQSLDQNKNLMILPNGKWVGGYIPAVYRSEPFALFPSPEGEAHQLHIRQNALVDQDTTNAVPLFKDDGEMSDKTQETLRFLGELSKGYLTTQKMIGKLHHYQLLEHWDLNQELSEESKTSQTPLNSLYKVNLNKINTLEDHAIADLQRSGALYLANLQFASTFRLKGLESFSKTYNDMLEKVNKTQEKPNIDELFGESSDVFSF